MQNAETVLRVIQAHGTQGQPLVNIYRQLYNPDLYLRAYARLYPNKGALTPGTTAETVDGMSLGKITALIDALRQERYRWTPVKRVYIPKKNGKQRPLGLPTWSDKLLQEVMRSILEAYYEPQFSPSSHGFRPNRGCHTALSQVVVFGKGTRWFIEGDIAQCFDQLDHTVLLTILRETIHDNRFLRLIETMLKAGYLENWRWNATYSGSPQGGVISPLLSNIYLNQLDRFVETVLIPEYTKGEKRGRNPAYRSLAARRGKLQRSGKHDAAKIVLHQMRQLPSQVVADPEFRRLRYVRYADDFLLSFMGTRAEAETIKQRLTEFLREQLNLELSTTKTLITHASSDAARFLGYEITVRYANDWIGSNGTRNVNGCIALRLPQKVLVQKCNQYKRDGKVIHRPERLQNSDFDIIAQYQAEYRGLIQYYQLAQNVCWLNTLRWTMETSLLKTLAGKHKTTVNAMVRKYGAEVKTPYGLMKCLKTEVERGPGKKPLLAQFGGLPLRHRRLATLNDQMPPTHRGGRTELISRLLADECELCGSTSNCEVHHVRKLADLGVKGRTEKPLWIQRMAALRRKTLVVCATCHDAIHAGRPTGKRLEIDN